MMNKIISQFILLIGLVFFFYLQQNAFAEDKHTFILPTLTYEEAIYHVEKISTEDADPERYKLEDILYNYITGEWMFYYDMIQGSHFIIIMNDKDPSKYRGIGGA